MKLVVFGATGNVGQRVVAEALRRGHEVVGVVRDPDAVQSPDPRVSDTSCGSRATAGGVTCSRLWCASGGPRSTC